jgi:hypothetical protein
MNFKATRFQRMRGATKTCHYKKCMGFTCHYKRLDQRRPSHRTPRPGVWASPAPFFCYFQFFFLIWALVNLNKFQILNKFQNLNRFQILNIFSNLNIFQILNKFPNLNEFQILNEFQNLWWFQNLNRNRIWTNFKIWATNELEQNLKFEWISSFERIG